MRLGWVAAAVRARNLAERRIGTEGCRRIAHGTWEEAAGLLLGSAYGHRIQPPVELLPANHAVAATTAWHLRVLAGWLPPAGIEGLRALTGGLEARNITGRAAELQGRSSSTPVDLGHLAVVWPLVARARSLADVRHHLAVSPWGDPGTDDLAELSAALDIAWARRVAHRVPVASDWARAAAVVLVAREQLLFGRRPHDSAARDLDDLLGHRWRSAGSLSELAAAVDARHRWVISGIDDAAELWRAELRWSRTVGDEARAVLERGRLDRDLVMAAAVVLLLDQAQVQAALELAAHRTLVEVGHGLA